MTRVSKNREAPRPEPEGKRDRNKLAKRERIRKAAYELITRTGFEATTVAKVAERAGVAKGTVFLYASDKQDLLFLVMHDLLSETVQAQLATLPRKAPLVEQLFHVFGGLFRMYARHPNLAAEFIRALPSASGPNGRQVDALTTAFVQQLADVVRDAAKRGEVRADVPHVLAAHNFFALYFGVLMGWVRGMFTLEVALDPMLKSALELQLRGLS